MTDIIKEIKANWWRVTYIVRCFPYISDYSNESGRPIQRICELYAPTAADAISLAKINLIERITGYQNMEFKPTILLVEFIGER